MFKKPQLIKELPEPKFQTNDEVYIYLIDRTKKEYTVEKVYITNLDVTYNDTGEVVYELSRLNDNRNYNYCLRTRTEGEVFKYEKDAKEAIIKIINEYKKNSLSYKISDFISKFFQKPIK